MILEDMVMRLKLLQYLKSELTTKGHTYKELSYLNGQIDLVNELTRIEKLNVLNDILQKTGYRFLKDIEKGEENLVDIFKRPSEWVLCKIDENKEQWFNSECLIFSTERQRLCFTKKNAISAQKYQNNKWQF